MKVGIVGATGMVGRKFLQLLKDHPYFEISDLMASKKSAGKRYSKACENLNIDLPERIKEMKVKTVEDELNSDLIFSALPSSAAKDIEQNLVKKGNIVASNASCHRMDEDVPLVVPEVNPDHLDLVNHQKEEKESQGFIVTNPNCTTIQLVLALEPLREDFGLGSVNIVSMQALSGAGYPGVPSLDMVDNVLPYIDGEEDKVENEPRKIFGELKDKRILKPDITISASCSRVGVSEGHLESVSVKLGKDSSIEELKKSMRNFQGVPQKLDLPTAPENPIIVMEESNRPQPKLDRNKEDSMAVVVGRLREDSILDYKFTVLGHNTIRGAAGASVLNAELLKEKAFI